MSQVVQSLECLWLELRSFIGKFKLDLLIVPFQSSRWLDLQRRNAWFLPFGHHLYLDQLFQGMLIAWFHFDLSCECFYKWHVTDYSFTGIFTVTTFSIMLVNRSQQTHKHNNKHKNKHNNKHSNKHNNKHSLLLCWGTTSHRLVHMQRLHDFEFTSTQVAFKRN